MALLFCLALSSDLERILQQHEASRNLIRTFQCKFIFFQEGISSVQGTYKSNEDTILFNFLYNNENVSCQIRNGVITSLFSIQPPRAERRLHEPHTPQLIHLWHMALFDINLGNGKIMPLAELCRKAGRVKIHRHDKGIDLEFSHDGADFKITLSPNHNFIATLVERRIQSDVFRHQSSVYKLRVEEFYEKDSIFFPSKTIAQIEVAGEEQPDFVHLMSDIKINEPLDLSQLRIHFPEGSHISDFIEGKVFYVDASGNNLREHERLKIAKAFLRDTRPVQPVAFHEVQKEPTSYLMYLFWICGGLVVVGLVWEIRRRVKLAR